VPDKQPSAGPPPYEPPTVTVLGPVTELTLGNKHGGPPDNSFSIPIAS